MNGPEFPRARAMLDPPGLSDSATWTAITGLAAAAILLIRAAKRWSGN